MFIVTATQFLLLCAVLAAGSPHDQARVTAPARVAVVSGFDVPESARYDPDRDVFYVSNVTGPPAAADNTGFISRVAADGRVIDLKWIAGGVNGVTLNGPKGLAIVGDSLWVADITVLRRFDRRTGRQVTVVDLAPKGAAFLNDVAAGPAGALFASDTGFVFGAGGRTLSGLQRIYRVDASSAVSVVVEGPELQAPNGVFWDQPNARLLIAPLAGKNVLEWSEARGLRVAASGPGGYDGIERLADGRLVVSSQTGDSVLAITGTEMAPLIVNVGDTADIGVDLKRNRVAIPRLDNNTVELWQLEPASPVGSGRLVYDEHRRRVVLLDAIATTVSPSETRVLRSWSWDGRKWDLLTGAGPSWRVVNTAVYDSLRRRIVMYGGTTIPSTGSLAETWQTDGVTWAEMAGASVEGRDHHAMTYDSGRGRSVLFGGGVRVSGQPYQFRDTTWEWDGVAWRQVATQGPGARGLASMTYDRTRKQVVLFGGLGAPKGPDSPRPYFNDTWLWNGRTWRRVADVGPPPRYGHAMAFDTAAGVALMYGGNTTDDQAVTDMWQWDGRRWSEIKLVDPTPGARFGAAMVYDAARRRTVLYGGRRDDKSVWEWDGKRWEEIK